MMDAKIIEQLTIKDSQDRTVRLKMGSFITLDGTKLQIRRYGRDREISWHELTEETCEYLRSVLKFVDQNELDE